MAQGARDAAVQTIAGGIGNIGSAAIYGFGKKKSGTDDTTETEPSNKIPGVDEWIKSKEKKEKGGEDAYLASSNLLVVADGVGGWESQGVDPGLYSRALIRNIKSLYTSNPAKYNAHPKQLLLEGH